MRSTWKGSISFGLLNVPVTVYPAEQRNDISFHLVDSRDHARVRYQRINEDTGEEVAWSEIFKAFTKAIADDLVRGATSVATFSARARPGAPVSAPVSRQEIRKGVAPDAFTVGNLAARLKRQRTEATQPRSVPILSALVPPMIGRHTSKRTYTATTEFSAPGMPAGRYWSAAQSFSQMRPSIR